MKISQSLSDFTFKFEYFINHFSILIDDYVAIFFVLSKKWFSRKSGLMLERGSNNENQRLEWDAEQVRKLCKSPLFTDMCRKSFVTSVKISFFKKVHSDSLIEQKFLAIHGKSLPIRAKSVYSRVKT